MFTFCCILKNENSIERFQMNFEERDIKWISLNNIDKLKEEIMTAGIDLVILDERIWWLDECKELLEKQRITTVLFKGSFNASTEEINLIIDELERQEEKYQEKLNKKELVDRPNTEIKIVEKIVKEVVEKVVYKSKDISKKVYAVISDDSPSLRDYFALNLGTYLSSLKNGKSIVIDITKNQNSINYIKLKKERKKSLEKDINPASILECCDYINDDILLLRIDNELSKGFLKNILFNLRDFENLVFILDLSRENIPKGFVLTLANKVYLLVEPLYPCIKQSFKILEDIKDCGQITENIKIILCDRTEDIGIWKSLYKDLYSLYELNRLDIVEVINKNKLLEGRRYKELFSKILDLDLIKEKKLFSFGRRKV